MTERHESGIPHRVAAIFCELGKSREELGIDEATETTQEWDNIVGNAPRDPKNSIYTVTYNDNTMGVPNDGINDDATRLGASITAFGSYPAKEDNPFGDPVLAVKIKGDLDREFPKITITLRPLCNELQYQYTGNANKSGEGEVGYETPNGDPMGDDLYKIAYYDSGQSTGLGFDFDNGIFEENLAEFTREIIDPQMNSQYFPTLTLEETHYWKLSDKPAEEPTPWEGLNQWDIEPSIYPRLPSEEPYNFLRNETYDFRYRYPSEYLAGKCGALEMNDGYFIKYQGFEIPPENAPNGVEGLMIPDSVLGTWTHTKINPAQNIPPITASSNPFFEPSEYSYASDSGIAPIIKGWFWDSTTPPTQNRGLYAVVASQNFKTFKKIRKRYAYSFRASYEEQPRISVIDHYNWDSSGNQIWSVVYDDFGETEGGNIIGYFTRPVIYEMPHGRFPQGQQAFGNQKNFFNCTAFWALEVTAKLEEWNSKKVTNQQTGKTSIVGAKIRGYIKLATMLLEKQGSSASGSAYYYSFFNTPKYGYFYYTPDTSFISPSVVFRCKRRTIGFDDQGRQIWDEYRFDAGEIPWEVTLTEANAKGKPIKVKDIRIAPYGVSGWRGEDNTLCYIHDFVVTQVIPP